MLGKSALIAVAAGTLGLAPSLSDSAQAAGTNLGLLRVLSIQSDAIEVKSDKGESKSGEFKGGASKSGPGPQQLQFKAGPQQQQFKAGPQQQQFKAGPQVGPQDHKVAPKLGPQQFEASPKKYKGSPNDPIKWVAPKHIPKGVQWVRGHRYHGSYFIVPLGDYRYANHYCYDWFYGPYGPGYYWSYDRCPVDDWWWD